MPVIVTARVVPTLRIADHCLELASRHATEYFTTAGRGASPPAQVMMAFLLGNATAFTLEMGSGVKTTRTGLALFTKVKPLENGSDPKPQHETALVF